MENKQGVGDQALPSRAHEQSPQEAVSALRVSPAIARPERLISFLHESLAIEGINRLPNDNEIRATVDFLLLPALRTIDVCRLQNIYAPGKPLRERIGMNVRVGGYVAPMGGRDIPMELTKLCKRVSRPNSDPWREHIAFERLHPFLDGNGRTGRAIWVWHMNKVGVDPFALSFLHRFYYQTLAGDAPKRNGFGRTDR